MIKYKNTIYSRNNHIQECTLQRFSNENLCFIDNVLSGRGHQFPFLFIVLLPTP